MEWRFCRGDRIPQDPLGERPADLLSMSVLSGEISWRVALAVLPAALFIACDLGSLAGAAKDSTQMDIGSSPGGSFNCVNDRYLEPRRPLVLELDATLACVVSGRDRATAWRKGRMREKRRVNSIFARKSTIGLCLIFFFVFISVSPSPADSTKSQIIDRQLESKSFGLSKVGTNPVRKMVIYLPAGYDPVHSSKRYPVIYFLPNPFEDYRSAFDRRDAQGLFDRAVARGVIEKFILVSVDMNTSLGSSWYVNSPATGNWEDFMIEELVPYIDANFKTLPSRDSRGIAGVFIGGYGAIRFGMRHPDVFGTVYAMHPVGTGSGVSVMDSLPKWDLWVNGKSTDDVKQDGRTQIFTTIFQAHLPNPGKPPFFIDLPAHKEGDRLIIDSKLTERLRNNFFLESMIPQCADNLKSLRGFKFDWSRDDGNYDHVYSALAFTHKLNEFGIVHEAEEYNGAWGEANWGPDGRIYTEVLPFFQRHLVFASNGDQEHQ